ncbi:hypothetical protein [Desulfosarcina sp. BuS5]|uniref:hypothetical protein n=1 Tax=Desulfosarcina sp. BuS5 TaxID=933262 RepID=UPI0012FA004B|nr:hypothetical protein [Desulfosarcina sp. BuS5]
MNSSISYKRANIWLATFLFIFKFSKYQRIAANHNIAINLEAPDLKRNYQKGTYKPKVRDFLINAVDSANALRLALLKSFLAVAITLCAALLIAFWQGSVNASLPLSWKSVIKAQSLRRV